MTDNEKTAHGIACVVMVICLAIGLIAEIFK